MSERKIEKAGLCENAQTDSRCKGLTFLNGLNGALVGTGAAADANVGIDDELLVALGNSLDGALVSAGTALDTSVSDIVCHDNSSICLL